MTAATSHISTRGSYQPRDHNASFGRATPAAVWFSGPPSLSVSLSALPRWAALAFTSESNQPHNRGRSHAGRASELFGGSGREVVHIRQSLQNVVDAIRVETRCDCGRFVHILDADVHVHILDVAVPPLALQPVVASLQPVGITCSARSGTPPLIVEAPSSPTRYSAARPTDPNSSKPLFTVVFTHVHCRAGCSYAGHEDCTSGMQSN